MLLYDKLLWLSKKILGEKYKDKQYIWNLHSFVNKVYF